MYIVAGLPDENGRAQILRIHTARMRENKKLSSDVDIEELAGSTKNFSGAEIEGLVRAATSTAMNRLVKVVCLIVFCCVLWPSSIRGFATPWTYFLHSSVILI